MTAAGPHPDPAAQPEPEIASGIETALVGDEPCLAFPRGRLASFRSRPARVDVLVPVWNGGANLQRCVSSVLGQTWTDLHLVIADNGSTDGGFARSCRWALDDDRVLVVQNAKNLGRVPNWNRCLDLATAEYAKLLMVNDVLLPAFVADLVAVLDANPDAAMARASLTLLQADGTTLFSPYFADSTYLARDAARLVSLARDNVAGCPAAQLWRRRLIEAHRLRFDESLSWAADYDFSTRLFEHGGLAYLRKALFLFDTAATRFFRAGDLVLRFKDECAVRTKALAGARGLDPSVVDPIATRLGALFASYAAQAASRDDREALERIHEEARADVRAALTPAPAPAPAPATTDPPRVSVIIPCYKQAHFLPEAVESLIAQTYTDWECIIVNDGSPDDTARVAEELAAKYAPRAIRVIHQENRGLSEARNRGIRASRGGYVLPFDSDDRLAPTMLSRLVAILDQRPDVAIAYTHAACFGVQNGVWKCGPFSVDLLREANRIPYCSLYRRGVWDAVGGYNPNLNAYEDWDFWVGAAERGFRAEGTEEALFLYRTKAVSMLTEAEARKPQLVARLVLNHPGLFPADKEAAARKILPDAVPERRPRAVPEVSVLVLRREGGAAFAATLRSVIEQSFQDFEIVVVNEGDAAGEAQVAEIDRGARVRYLRAGRGEGRAAARNAGLAVARGRRIAYADEGDILYGDHLQALVAAADAANARVVYADAHLPREARGAGAKAASAPAGAATRALALSAHAGGDVYLAGTRLALSMLLHDRALVAEVGAFDEALGALEDWDLQIRLLALAAPAHVARPLCELGGSGAEARAAQTPGGKPLLEAMRAAVRRKHEAAFVAAERRRDARLSAEVAKAETLVKSGDVPAALAAMEGFVRDMGYWAPAHDRLAAMYRSAGKLAEALASVVAALELDPTSQAIWQNAKAIQQAVEGARAPRAARTA